MSSSALSFAPVAAPTGAPIRLAMQRLWLAGQVLPAGARLVVQHVFQSDEARPLEVIYAFALPRDAALRRFRITGDGFEAHSELKPVEEAVKVYEQGVADGSLSTLARQYGDGVVNLTVGNIRPKERVTVLLEVLAGVELRDDGFRFRFPFTLAPAYHSRARAAATAGEGEIELPADEFGDMILPGFRQSAKGLHEVGFELSVLQTLPVEEIGSPSHSIRVRQATGQPTAVALAREKDVPNRDLVLDVRFRGEAPQVLSGPAGDGKRSFAAVVPSTLFGRNPGTPRRTAILLDRSGSMDGEPIAQARKAIEACLAALSEDDSFGLLAFDDRVEAMHQALVPATREQRECARAFLKKVKARGGTGLAAGVREAARVLGGQGDIVVITDGQVFATEEILAQARATGVRLFCLGIGSASQDRFLSLLARETGGISRFVTARERVDLAAVDLFASMARPVASGLKASPAEPEAPHVVFAGVPVLLFGETESDGEKIELTWDGGRMGIDVPPGNAETGQVVRLLRGSRLITDWESRYPSEEAFGAPGRRKRSRIAARLIELSREYGLGNRDMSLVAVVKRPGDRPGDLPDTRVVPVGMPQDTAFPAYFGGAVFDRVTLESAAQPLAVGPLLSLRRSRHARKARASGAGATAAQGDDLLDLAAILESDGGMPGDSSDERAARTIAAVLAFAAEGHTLTTGTFRLHLTRLVRFLKSLAVASDTEQRLIERALDAASTGKAPAGEWLALAREPGTSWTQIEAALKYGPK